MCAFDDSLTEIDWLNSLCIQKRSEIKEGNILPVTISPQSFFATPQNSPNENYSVSRFNGYDKPSYSYAYLIKLAIESSNNKKMKLNEIYSWISETFPYYKYMQIDNNKGWKNAIRHNLSLNKIFKRCAKDSSHLGKGSYWTIDSNFDDDIHYPPVKKMKFVLNSSKSVKSNILNDNIKSCSSRENITSSISEDASTTVPLVYTLLSSSNATENNAMGPIMTSVPMISTPNFDATPIEVPILFSNFQSKIEKESESQSCVFSTESAFLPYSNEHQQNCSPVETCEIPEYSCEIPEYSCEIPEYSCEISYLEVDEDITCEKSANNDFILKTPVLSQINSLPEDVGGINSDSKDVFEENDLNKSSMPNSSFISISQDVIDNSFDSLSFYDSFVSIQQPLFESESRSFELSQSTRKYLFNLSGVKENLLHRSQWLDLQDNEDMQSQCPYDALYETLRSEDLLHNVEERDNLNYTSHDSAPTKEYLELKSSLINYKYKSNATNSNRLSVSTSSTEKSSNTLRSKSDIYKKSDSFDSASEFDSLKQNISENCTCDGEDEIRDIFPWDSIT